jgi:hypothetical protein
MSKLLIKREPESFPNGVAYMPLGDGYYATVDPEDYAWLSKFRWTWAKSSSKIYAVRKKHIQGKEITIRMHREIAKTPAGMDCHHISRNSLNNRKANLINLTPIEHIYAHKSGALG